MDGHVILERPQASKGTILSCAPCAGENPDADVRLSAGLGVRRLADEPRL